MRSSSGRKAAHRPLEEPQEVLGVRQRVEPKVNAANKRVLNVDTVFVQVVTKGKGVSKKEVAQGTGAGVHEDQDRNVLGKAGAHAPN